jgi:polyhydroxyalkanoate synthesis regulator phasin
MSLEVTYKLLVEELKEGSLKPEEAKKILNEMASKLEDDQIEEVEDLIHEKEQENTLIIHSYYDTVPYDAEAHDGWWNEDNGWGEES